MSNEVYKFEDFVLDKNTREIQISGETLAIEPQVFSLLIYLIENKDRVISKDELIENIWDGRFVSESAISSRIKSARKTLNDNGKDQRLIRTVHGVGFRFVGELIENQIAEEIEQIEEQESETPLPNPKRRAEDKYPSRKSLASNTISNKKLIVPVALLLTVAIAIFLLLKPADEVLPASTRIAILPVDNGTEDTQFDWTSLGLMSYVTHYLSKGEKIKTVAPQSMMSINTDDLALDAVELSISQSALSKLRNAQSASHVVVTRLTKKDDLVEMQYSIYSPKGKSPVQKLVGETPIEVAKALGRSIVSTLPKSGNLNSELRSISSDPFVSEAYARGRALQLQGDPEEARNLFKVAYEQEPTDIWLRYEYALSTRMMGRTQEALTLFSELEKEAELGEDNQATVAIKNALGILYWIEGNRSAAEEKYQSALQSAEKVADKKYLGSILINLGILARNRGEIEASRTYLNRALTEFSNAGYEQAPGSLLNSLANLEHKVGNVDKAKKYLLEALEGARLADNNRHASAMLTNLGSIEQQLGNWQLSEVYLNESLEIRQRIQNKTGVVKSFIGLAQLHTDIGKFDSAMLNAEQAIQAATEIDNQPLLAKSLNQSGRIHLLAGNAETARESLKRAKEIYQNLNQEEAALETDVHLYRVNLYQNLDLDGLEDKLEKLDLEGTELPYSLVLYASELAADLHIKNKSYQAAITALLKATKVAEKLNEHTHLVRLSAKLGMLYLSNDNQGQAASMLGNVNQLVPKMYESLRFSAFYESYLGNHESALQLMQNAKQVAFDRWTEEDEQVLIEFTSNS